MVIFVFKECKGDSPLIDVSRVVACPGYGGGSAIPLAVAILRGRKNINKEMQGDTKKVKKAKKRSVKGLSVEGLTILKKQPSGHFGSFATAVMKTIFQHFDADGDGVLSFPHELNNLIVGTYPSFPRGESSASWALCLGGGEE